MLSLEALDIICKRGNPGYSSVYMFMQDDAEAISRAGHSRGLDQYAVASEHLVFDIDTGLEGLEVVGSALRDRELAFEIWSSGGKGFHVYVPHALAHSIHLPYSHLEAAREIAGTSIDETLYQHGRLISLPGRIHPKTRNKKKLLKTIKGNELSLELRTTPIKPIFNIEVETDQDLLYSGLTRAAELVRFPPFPGNRHTRIWSISETLAQAGLSYDTVLNLMTEINETWEHQKSSTELELAVQQAFKLYKKP